jgi:hypothetical protein
MLLGSPIDKFIFKIKTCSELLKITTRTTIEREKATHPVLEMSGGAPSCLQQKVYVDKWEFPMLLPVPYQLGFMIVLTELVKVNNKNLITLSSQ